jgi:surface polysaccharide O-acyltransferase-like enzyme
MDAAYSFSGKIMNSNQLLQHLSHVFLEPDKPLEPTVPHQRIFDVMRTLACICVVVFHVSSNYHSLFDLSTQGSSWWISHLVNGLVINFLAPVFFVISGALLLNPHQSEQPLKVFLKRRLKTILPPFLLASLFYYSYTHLFSGDFNILYFIMHVWGEPQYYHLWFFYALIALYLAAPIFHTFITPQNRTVIRYGLFLWLLGTGLAPVIQHFSTVRITIIPTVIYNYTGYFIFGAYFFWMRSSNLKSVWAWTGLISMTLVTWLGSYWLTITSGQYDSFFFDQIGLNIILATLCSVSLIARIDMDALDRSRPVAGKLICLLSQNSLMIYILHPFINETLPLLIPFLQPESMHPLFRIPLQTFLILLVILSGLELVRLMTALTSKTTSHFNLS